MPAEVICPVRGCGKLLARVEGTAGVVWRKCPGCGAVLRHEIGTGQTVIERPPSPLFYDRMARRSSNGHAR